MITKDFKEFCLSPGVTMGRSQKLINRSYLNNRVGLYFYLTCIGICIWITFMIDLITIYSNIHWTDGVIRRKLSTERAFPWSNNIMTEREYTLISLRGIGNKDHILSLIRGLGTKLPYQNIFLTIRIRD